MKKIYLLLFTITFSSLSFGQITITALNSPYTQNFDVMGTGTAFPTDWTGIRAGGSGTANQILTPAITNGAANSGGAYNVGTTSATDRALGSIASGTTIPAIGASFKNTTGTLISKISLAGVMEQWRSGDNAITENLVFS